MTSQRDRSLRWQGLLILFTIALSLRPELVGAVTLVEHVSAGLGMSHLVAGLIGSLPVLCMGLFAFATPLIRGRLGTRATVSAGLALIAVGGLTRSVVGDASAFLVLTFAIGVGIGVGGAILPVVVRQTMPDAPVEGTAAYSAGLQLGSAAAAASVALLVTWFGGWQGALAVISAVLLIPLAVWLRFGPPSDVFSDIGVRLVRTSVDGHSVVLALAFGLFGIAYYGYIAWLADAYVERGWSAVQAGMLIAVLNVASLIGALSAAQVSRRFGYERSLVTTSIGFAVGSVGFVVLPDAGFGWAALVGCSNGALLPLLLAQPVRRGRSTDETAWLSAVMLGGGYTLAAVAPVALGALRDLSGTFGPSFTALAAAAMALPLLAITMVRAPQRS